MRSSIRVRLTLSHLTVIVLAMGLSGFLLLSFLERYFLQAMEDSLIAQARITAQALVPGARVSGPSVDVQAPAYNAVQQQQVGNLTVETRNLAPTPLDPSFDLGYLVDASFQLSTQLDTRIRILDTQGLVQVDSQPAGRGADLRSDPLVTQALTGQYASRTDPPELGAEAAMHLALPVQLDNRVVGVVYLSQALRDVIAVLRDLRTRWLLSTAIALVLSGGVGFLLSRAIANPLHRLTAAAGAVAEGQLDQQVPVGSRDELGRLSQAFNEMTARLRAARQMQTDIVANVSHELRTPLTSIKGLVETLRDGAVDDLQVRDSFLETIEHETDHLIRLVNDLLLLSRADSEALNLRPEPLDLAQLVQKTVHSLTPQAEARGLAISVEMNPACSLVWADPDRLRQVLVNLLDNAIKYSRPDNAITLKVDCVAGQRVQVQIKDTGIGVPVEELARLGQRFYRVDKARSRSEGGSGLGLAIAQALVKAHGGQFWIESQEEQGTTVTFTLPAA
ncbi:MAG: HAMP domain-containing protein [Chloroflexi bacterium]|nr:HAMP domain-containing protein [Chloroflexota bacterium]